MNTESNAMPGFPHESQASAPVPIVETRPLYWSIRRELWENRSIYIAPLIAGGVYLLGYTISLLWLPQMMRARAELDPMQQHIKLAEPYAHAGMLIMLVAFIVGIFYSLDALHGERRDRSILFWKSLPVSDLTTVLSKASIPLVILPVLVFVITIAVQWIIFVLSYTTLMMSGTGHAMPWAPPVFEMQLVQLYSLIVIALWHAPLYGWALLISGYARRATFLWAVLPPIAISAFEVIAFHTTHFARMMGDRLFGFTSRAFDLLDKNGAPMDAHFIPLARLAPLRFLGSPSLWLGLIFAAICIAAAVRLRRYQGPI